MPKALIALLAAIAVIGASVVLGLGNKPSERADANSDGASNIAAPMPVAEPDAVAEPHAVESTDEVDEAYRRWANVPISERPAFSLEFRYNRQDILSHRTDGPFRYEIMSEDELEELARAGHPLAKSALGSRLQDADPLRAVDLFMESVTGGVIENLPLAGRALSRVALDEDAPELRDAIMYEAYVRVIASVMFGLGEYHGWVRNYRSAHGESGIRSDLCVSAAALVDRINADRAAQNLAPIDVMFNVAEITRIMQSHHGICG